MGIVSSRGLFRRKNQNVEGNFLQVIKKVPMINNNNNITKQKSHNAANVYSSILLSFFFFHFGFIRESDFFR